MKKFYSFLCAAVALVGFAACSTDATEEVAPAGAEKVSFTAAIENTKTDLDDANKTTWVAGDVVVIKGYEFVCAEDAATFSCTTPGVSTLLNQEVEAVYSYNKNGQVDSKAGKAGAVLTATSTLTAEGATFNFAVQNAFLHFTATGAVTLKADQEIFSTGKEFAVEQAGEYYVAINPAKEVAFSYESNGVVMKSTTITFAKKTIYNLGELETISAYGVVGSFQGWNAANPVKMYNAADGWAVAEGVELYKSDEIKIVKDNNWISNGGGFKAPAVAEVDTDCTLDGTENIKVAKNGKFDIYYNGATKTFKYTCVEEYTGTVDITIDNKANWSPLSITLKDGENVIAENATVTDNKFAVNMDYIGSSLSYTLSNGTKTMEGNVTITKDGATINLEETVIKLKVQLNTSNSKQWWGNTMKIHVWETGTSFDTAWPGNTMTSEGNYTWSIQVPSELVGKTIKYLVHNGNGWQSNDSTVTIGAEGNTVQGSSIGIN